MTVSVLERLNKRKPVPTADKPVAVLNSPLRYPGGKTRAVKLLMQYVPPNTKTICSPFLGGGSFELALASFGVKVYGYDVFSPLVNFWEQLLNNPDMLSAEVKKFFPLPHKKFYELQRNYKKITDDLEKAAVFYVLNRCSFSGTTLSGGMSLGHPRFTEKGINNLANFRIADFSVTCADFHASIGKHKKDFLYCDPPYMNGESLYGIKGGTHKDFDHIGLRDLLVGRDKWALSYNDCSEVRDLYSGHSIIKPEWVYGMGNKKTSSEVLILSKDYN